MKRYIIIFLLCISQISRAEIIGFVAESACCGWRQKTIESPKCCCCNKINQRSHSFMYTRPLDQYAPIEQFAWYNVIYNKKTEARAAFSITAAYIQSQHSESSARYFLPTCNTNVLVSGDSNVSDLKDRAIRAEWIGLPDNFRGQFTIEPEQTQLGFIAQYNKDLGSILDVSFFDGMWFNIQLPVVFVKNNIGFEQYDVINQNTQFPTDLVEAFQQPSWKYGKIYNDLSRVALSEINLKLGRAYLADDFFLVAYHSLMRIPTGNQEDPTVLFDPVVGNNNHFGIGAGVNFQILLNKDITSYAFCFYLDLESTFFIKKDQWRTFDLMGKPWSRYLLLTNIDGVVGNTTQAVNVLTREVRVHLYNTADFSFGWRLKTKRVEAEIGYDLWGRGNEHIEWRCKFPATWGIAGTPDENSTQPVTASCSTIACKAPNDVRIDPVTQDPLPVFIPIVQSDIDDNSGAAQASLNHMLHASLGLVHKGVKMDGFLGCGVFFEFAQKNTALNTIGGWAKVGSSF